MNYIFIDDFEKLTNESRKWNELKEIAIDIECENNLHHFGAYISLIQLSSRGKNWVIDALAVKDLSPFLNILENKNIQKVIHDVSFDLRILNQQAKTLNIYDTQLAALFLGKENLGLKNLLEDYFGIHKQKKFQRVDWTRRPLSKEMLAYAVQDSAYLLQLKDKLDAELSAKGRLSWVEEECALLEKMNYIYHEQTYLDVTGAKSLAARELGRFHVLFDLRQEIARMVDKPPFMVIRNKSLLDFAKSSPNWYEVRGVHPMVRKMAKKFKLAVDSSESEIRERKIHKKFTLEQAGLVKVITQLRLVIADSLGLKPYLLLNQEQIKNIVLNRNLDSLKRWQKELLSDKIEKVIH